MCKTLTILTENKWARVNFLGDGLGYSNEWTWTFILDWTKLIKFSAFVFKKNTRTIIVLFQTSRIKSATFQKLIPRTFLAKFENMKD